MVEFNKHNPWHSVISAFINQCILTTESWPVNQKLEKMRFVLLASESAIFSLYHFGKASQRFVGKLIRTVNFNKVTPGSLISKSDRMKIIAWNDQISIKECQLS